MFQEIIPTKGETLSDPGADTKGADCLDQGDVAVVGYDNREFTWIVRPSITTVVMPVYEMGRMAAEILLQQIVDGTRENEEVKVKGEKILASNSIRSVSRDKAA